MNKAHIAHHPHIAGAPSGKGGLHHILEGVLSFTRKNTVMVIALVLAAATSVIVPPDAEYLGYFDFKTLTCLFCVLAVVCALKNIRFFYMLAQQIVRLFKNARMCVLALVYDIYRLDAHRKRYGASDLPAARILRSFKHGQA